MAALCPTLRRPASFRSALAAALLPLAAIGTGAIDILSRND
jgi:hypothetical protein